MPLFLNKPKGTGGTGGGGGDANIVDSTIDSKSTWSSAKIELEKANKIHKHEISDVNGLDTALSSIVPSNHKHPIDDVTDLKDTLDTKSDITHKHEISDVNGLDVALSNIVPSNHNHSINDVTDLKTTLDQKSDINHVHDWSSINNKPSSLPSNIDKAVTDMHTHANKNVIDFLAGPGNTLTYKGQPIDGFRSVYTLIDRDNIPLAERKDGMLCLVLTDGSMYYLKGGVDNAFWEIFSVAAGGATSASSLHYTATGNLTGVNVQAAIDELESTKASSVNIYSKAETDLKLANHTHSYNNLTDLPNLSSLHAHTNKGTLDKFSEVLGELSWNGKTLGNMIGDVYDSDGDGLVDKASTLQGLLATIQQLNYTVGLTGNIQQQFNALSAGTIFKGEYFTYADMAAAVQSPTQGYWVFVEQDETKGNAKTQYYHDGTDWIYGGGAAQVGESTQTTLGGVMLTGALDNPLGTAQNPLLNATGVAPGLYKSANIVIAEDGRISSATEGTSAFINDANSSVKETWSSSKIEDEFNAKSPRNHTHPQLHDADMLGNVQLDTKTVSDKRVVMYNAVTGKAEWTDSQGGKVYVGSRVISGDYRLASGANISLFIDEIAKTITINSTYQGGGGSGVPTLTEITQTVEVPAGGTVALDLDAAFNKYDIRTVDLKNSENVLMDVSIYDMAVGGRRIYYSNQELQTYDIVNVPCHDKDQSQKLHLVLKNHGNKTTIASVVVTTTNLV